MDNWYLIDTAPKDGTRILVWPVRRQNQGLLIQIAHWHQPGNPKINGYWIITGVGSCNPTHWKNMPTPPSE